MAKVLIVAAQYRQGKNYAAKKGFKDDGNCYVATPDYFPIGYHPEEVYVVGSIVPYWKLIIQLRSIIEPTAKVFVEEDLPNG